MAPAAATHAYADRARDAGVELVVGRAARPWLDGARVRGVELDDGSRLAAPDVLVATGPWAPTMIDPTGSWRPIRPSWGVVLAVTLAEPPRHVIEEAEMDIEPGSESDADVAPATGAAPEAESATAIGDAEFSLVTARGSSSLGTTFLATEPDAGAYVPVIVERATRFLPAIATAPHRRPPRVRPPAEQRRPAAHRSRSVDRRPVDRGRQRSVGHLHRAGDGAVGRRAHHGLAGEPPPAFDPGRFGGV